MNDDFRKAKFALVTITIVVGCTKAEPPPTAVGSVVFSPSAMVVSPDAGPPIDMSATIIATELEVVRSDRVVRSAVRARALAAAFKLDEDQTVRTLRDATSASRRGQSLVLELDVRVPDPSLAKESCNAILSAYVDSRMAARIEAAAMREEWLRGQLDAVDAGSPLAASLRAQADDAAAERSRRDSDVSVLDVCAPAAKAK